MTRCSFALQSKAGAQPHNYDYEKRAISRRGRSTVKTAPGSYLRPWHDDETSRLSSGSDDGTCVPSRCLSLAKGQKRSRNFFFSQGLLKWTIAGRIDAVTLSCLETGAFQLILRVKSAFLSIASPPRLRTVKTQRVGRGKPSVSGDFFPQAKDVRRKCVYARAGACAAKAVLLPARSEVVVLFVCVCCM